MHFWLGMRWSKYHTDKSGQIASAWTQYGWWYGDSFWPDSCRAGRWMFQRPASACASQELPSHHSLLNLKLWSLGNSFYIVLLYWQKLNYVTLNCLFNDVALEVHYGFWIDAFLKHVLSGISCDKTDNQPQDLYVWPQCASQGCISSLFHSYNQCILNLSQSW